MDMDEIKTPSSDIGKPPLHNEEVDKVNKIVHS
jgi:hypothetical protein